jgi:DNA polymerase III epsilon subunit-like protein
MTDYIVFDFETTGFSPVDDTVLQLSALKVKGGEKETFNAFVKYDGEIAEGAQAVHGITTEMLMAEGIDGSEAWGSFLEFLGDELPLVGHNIVNFDVKFMEENCRRLEMKAPERSRYVDTAMLYKAKKMGERHDAERESHWQFCERIGRARIYGLKFNLALCCDENGIDRTPFTAHRADGDVEMTNLIYLLHLKSVE